MSSFTKAEFVPTDKKRNGRVVYKLANGGFKYDIGYLGSGLSVHVPEGFETDGPSIPSIVIKFFDVEKMMNSAAVHDMLRENLRFKKLEGDLIFHMAMQAEGTPMIQREISALAVRFNKNRNVYNQEEKP